MDDEIPDEVREKLDTRFERAEELGLSPEWLDDDHRSFEYDCPHCKADGIEHRATQGWTNPNVLNVVATPIGLLFPLDQDQASGPAG
jgi:hypothetical protein